jgi:hypothetical protein
MQKPVQMARSAGKRHAARLLTTYVRASKYFPRGSFHETRAVTMACREFYRDFIALPNAASSPRQLRASDLRAVVFELAQFAASFMPKEKT